MLGKPCNNMTEQAKDDSRQPMRGEKEKSSPLYVFSLHISSPFPYAGPSLRREYFFPYFKGCLIINLEPIMHVKGASWSYWSPCLQGPNESSDLYLISRLGHEVLRVWWWTCLHTIWFDTRWHLSTQSIFWRRRTVLGATAWNENHFLLKHTTLGVLGYLLWLNALVYSCRDFILD